MYSMILHEYIYVCMYVCMYVWYTYMIYIYMYHIKHIIYVICIIYIYIYIYILHFIYLLWAIKSWGQNSDQLRWGSNWTPPDERKLLKTVVNETRWKENRIKWKLIDIQKTTIIFIGTSNENSDVTTVLLINKWFSWAILWKFTG